MEIKAVNTPLSKPNATAETPLAQLLSDLEASAAALVHWHRKSVRDKKHNAQKQKQLDRTITKVQNQLHPIHHFQDHADRVLESYCLSMFTGAPKMTFYEAAHMVKTQNRILRHWRNQQTCRVRLLRSGMTISDFDASLDLKTWDGINVFELEKETQEPLSTIFAGIWTYRHLDSLSKVKMEEVIEYVSAIEAAYKQNPYHSRTHAAQTTLLAYQLSAGLMSQTTMEGFFTKVDLLMVVLAAAIHDVGHPAVNNDFLIKTRDPLALRYNDRSPLENYHAAFALQLMKDQGVDLLRVSVCASEASLRLRMIDMVLATDMVRHKTLLQELESEIEGMANLQDIDKKKVEQNLLHAADIGHPLLHFDRHEEWTKRMTAEFYEQGDRERELGFVPMAMLDREKARWNPVAKGQIGFLKFVVSPSCRVLAGIFEEDEQDVVRTLLRHLEENMARWEVLAAEDGTASTPVSRENLSSILPRRPSLCLPHRISRQGSIS